MGPAAAIVAVSLLAPAAPALPAADAAQITEWTVPWAQSRPRDPYVAPDGRVWFVETGARPNRLVGFDPRTERFFGSAAIASGGGAVRHMVFHAPTREIWFGTDTNTRGRAKLQ